MHSSHCQDKPFAQCAGSRAAARQARADAGGRRTGHRRERQGLADLSWCALASVWSSRTKTRCDRKTRLQHTGTRVQHASSLHQPCCRRVVCTVSSFGYSTRSPTRAHTTTGQLVPASLACGPCAYPPRPPTPAARLHGCLRNLRPASTRAHIDSSRTQRTHTLGAHVHTPHSSAGRTRQHSLGSRSRRRGSSASRRSRALTPVVCHGRLRSRKRRSSSSAHCSSDLGLAGGRSGSSSYSAWIHRGASGDSSRTISSGPAGTAKPGSSRYSRPRTAQKAPYHTRACLGHRSSTGNRTGITTLVKLCPFTR